MAGEIERNVGFCYRSENVDEAIRIVEKDPGIDVVVFSLERKGPALESFLADTRRLNSTVTMIGSGSADHAKALAPFSVLTIPKNWSWDDIQKTLEDDRLSDQQTESHRPQHAPQRRRVFLDRDDAHWSTRKRARWRAPAHLARVSRCRDQQTRWWRDSIRNLGTAQ